MTAILCLVITVLTAPRNAVSRDFPAIPRAKTSNEDDIIREYFFLCHVLPRCMEVVLVLVDLFMAAESEVGGGVRHIKTLGQLAPSNKLKTFSSDLSSDTSVPLIRSSLHPGLKH